MTWNWELPDWPNFLYDPNSTRDLEDRFLEATGRFVGAVSHLSGEDLDQLRIDLVSDEALETSKIEGELLNRESIQSSVRRELGLGSDNRRVSPAERGISEVLVDVYRHFDEGLTDKKLCRWHKLLMQGRTTVGSIGSYRTGSEPMQIISGLDYHPNVHFVAPPSAAVPAEMARFLVWFNGTRGRMPALERAAISHIYFESIHPFEDGNGRIGRAVAELSLSQAIGRPTLIALSQAINSRRGTYYDELGKGNQTLEVQNWVRYFSETILDAQQRAQRSVSFIIEKGKYFDRLRGKLNPRQEKVLIRMFAAGPDGFTGGLSAGNYMSIAKSTVPTTTRDLNALVEIGALRKAGERRHTRYWLDLPEPR